MKRIKLLLVIFINAYVQIGNGQITFQKTFGVGMGSDAHQTTDGGYIITGTKNGSVFLIKTNTFGDSLWYKTYGGSNGDGGSEVHQTNDGGYIVLGYTASFGAGSNDVYLIKTDSFGDTLWSKTYGLSSSDIGYSVRQMIDSGYFIVGTIGSSYIYVIKTNSIGDTIFTKTFHKNTNDDGMSGQQTTDGGFIIVGTTADGIGNYEDVYLIKLQPNGDTSWTKTYGGVGHDYGNSIQQTADGGYIIAGGTSSFGAGSTDVYLIKTDSLGDTLFTKTYGGTDDEAASSVAQTTDGGYIITGCTNSFGAGLYDVYLIKTDMFGDTLWTRTFGGTGEDIGYSVQPTSDGGYIITGSTTSFGVGNHIYLIKTDANGNKASPCYTNNAATIVGSTNTQVVRPPTIVGSGAIVTSPSTIIGGGDTVSTLCFTTGIQETKPSLNTTFIYPNPNDGSFTLHYSLSSSKGEFHIIDVMGRLLYSNTISGTEGTQVIDVSTLAKGIYYWEVVSVPIESGGISGMGKLAIMK
jgi:hypothetical protein